MTYISPWNKRLCNFHSFVSKPWLCHLCTSCRCDFVKKMFLHCQWRQCWHCVAHYTRLCRLWTVRSEFRTRRRQRIPCRTDMSFMRANSLAATDVKTTCSAGPLVVSQSFNAFHLSKLDNRALFYPVATMNCTCIFDSTRELFATVKIFANSDTLVHTKIWKIHNGYFSSMFDFSCVQLWFDGNQYDRANFQHSERRHAPSEC